MRSLIKVLLKPIIEPLLERLERRVLIEKHIELITQLLDDISRLQTQLSEDSSSVVTTLRSVSSSVNKICVQQLLPKSEIYSSNESLSLSSIKGIDLEELVDEARFETYRELLLIQSVSLIDEKSIKDNKELEFTSELKEILEYASWSGSGKKIAAARIISAVIFGGLKGGFVTPENANNILSELIKELPPKVWFSSKGAFYGSSFVLRSFLILCHMSCANISMDYVQDVSERLLRHVEVKREQALQFRSESVPSDAFCLLERLRFTLGILDAAGIFQDIRYLNTALKLNDWHYRGVRKIKLPKKLKFEDYGALMIVLHYILSITKQERLWKEFFEE